MDKVAIVIGHNLRAQGAYIPIIKSEYTYWKKVAELIQEAIPDKVDVYERKPNKTYGAEMREMLNELNKHNYRYCLELHYNAGTKTSTGSYCLVYYKNGKARELATDLLARIQAKFDVSPIRILNFNNKVLTGLYLVNSDDVKGGYGICHSKPTYILVEPFFGSNPNEAVKFMEHRKVADVFINFIKEV